MSRQNRKRSAPSNFDWQDNDNEEDIEDRAAYEALTTKIYHTQFNLDSGVSKVSSWTSYITTPASPEKVLRPEASASAYKDIGRLACT